MDAKALYDVLVTVLQIFTGTAGAVVAGFTAYRFMRKWINASKVEEMKHYAELHTKIAECKEEIAEIRHDHNELSERHDTGMEKIHSRLDEIYSLLIKEKK